jgi:type III restriction enzyme
VRLRFFSSLLDAPEPFNMSQVVIENPIINSPFDEPTHHFKFSDEGITNEVVAGRRTSSYFVPIAKSKKKGSKQLQFDTAQMHRPMLR